MKYYYFLTYHNVAMKYYQNVTKEQKVTFTILSSSKKSFSASTYIRSRYVITVCILVTIVEFILSTFVKILKIQ